MAHTVIDKLANDLRFRTAFLLLGAAIAVLVGLVTASLSAADIVASIFLMVAGLCRFREEESQTTGPRGRLVPTHYPIAAKAAPARPAPAR
jgi:hypothetical protein